jgi:hypothetical protein
MPDGAIQHCVLDQGHEGPHLDQTVQRSWWNEDSDIEQEALDQPVSQPPSEDAGATVTDPTTERRVYRTRVPVMIEEYRQAANRNQQWNNWLQGFVIVLSFATSALTGLGFQAAGFRWAAVSTSAGAGMAAGFIAYFKYRARSLSEQRAADAIERELESCNLGIGDYADKDEERRLTMLAVRVEALREEQQKRALELEQQPWRRNGQPLTETGPP